jgi:hypothetical protein
VDSSSIIESVSSLTITVERLRLSEPVYPGLILNLQEHLYAYLGNVCV